MSRLHELIEQARASNPELGNALAEEVQRLEDRPTFGLVFERHAPEATELYGRPITQGDKVHVLKERGSTAEADQTLWRVQGLREGDATGPEAHLVETLPGNQEWDAQAVGREPEEQTALVENLVVVAEHTDTIYPGLVETGRVDNGSEDAPAHTIINAENLHALQALTYTHRHSIDCIYIDPPYNTGAKDWKYNNDYVEADDDYRHSKWLSFMEKRLLLAKELLNPADSVLIVTIDEKEYMRLGLLLQQLFPNGVLQMISSVINPSGSSRVNYFSRSDEYIFFVFIGEGKVCAGSKDMLHESEKARSIRWDGLMRRGANGKRTARPNLFYPIIFSSLDGSFVGVGDPLDLNVGRESFSPGPERFAVFPIAADGQEATWGLKPSTFMENKAKGYVRFGPWKPGLKKRAVYFLQSGTIKAIENGEIETLGFDEDGAILTGSFNKRIRPMTTWVQQSHSAGDYGMSALRALLPGRHFPFPKSLYAVEDALRFATADKPNAVILDFFAGSGTTAHAVMRLNKQDGGKRRSIMVTNNEVSAEEQKALRERGLRPGDPDWEALGIADYVTKPRVTAAITGMTPEGDSIKGDYKFTDEFPMSDGFEANARYFSLEYLNPVMVEYGYAFSRIAPLLWMRAGQVGPVIEELPDRGWEVTDHYAVIENCDDAPTFTEAVKERPGITHVYIITDNVSVYRRVARGFDDSIKAIQLYESYLTNFAINASRVLK